MNAARFAALLLLAPLVQAQSVVSPKHFTNAEGTNYSSDGLGSNQTPFRFLQVHGDLAGTPRTITSLALRREGTLTSTYAARTVVLDLFVSTGTTSASAPNTTFDGNHGANKVQLATFKTVVLPESVNATLPGPFAYQIPFDQPFSYDGSGPLCWELRIQARQSTSSIYHDQATGAQTNPYMQDNYVGAGCKSADHGSVMQLRADGVMNWNSGSGNISFNGNFAPKNSFDYFLVGTSGTSFSGVPLPLEIAPASSPSGRCMIYNNIVVLLPALATATGTVSTSVGVPATLDFHGGRVFGQMIAFEPAANAIGIITSNMVVLNWLAPFTSVPVGQVSLGGSLGASGTAKAHTGYVVQFE